MANWSTWPSWTATRWSWPPTISPASSAGGAPGPVCQHARLLQFAAALRGHGDRERRPRRRFLSGRAATRPTARRCWKTPRENQDAQLLRAAHPRASPAARRWCCPATNAWPATIPDNGRRHWVIDGPTEQFVASPVYSERTGLLFITGGYPDHHILAIRPDGAGNVTHTHIVWRTTRAWPTCRRPSSQAITSWSCPTPGWRIASTRRPGGFCGTSASGSIMPRWCRPKAGSIS